MINRLTADQLRARASDVPRRPVENLGVDRSARYQYATICGQVRAFTG